jgi:hypothetical protein
MATEDLIRQLEDEGFLVIRPRTPTEDLRANWNQILSVLRMSEDLVAGGAKLTVKHPAWLGNKADPVRLLRDGVVGRIDLILAGAVVEREEEKAA